jgi:hypothetical protein
MRDIVILCEDAQAACLLRRFFHECKIAIVKEVTAPAGLGSGEKFVRQRYPTELDYCRRRKSKLMVCTDADTLSLQQREQQLDEACREAKQSPRSRDDQVALFIPKRNIETWLEFLTGNLGVNEEENYSSTGPHRPDKKRCQQAAEELYQYCKGLKNPPTSLPSLQSACVNEAPRVI